MATYRIERMTLQVALIDAPDEATAQEIGEHMEMADDRFRLLEDRTTVFEQVED